MSRSKTITSRPLAIVGILIWALLTLLSTALFGQGIKNTGLPISLVGNAVVSNKMGNWTNDAGSVIVNNGLIFTSDDWVNNGTYDPNTSGGFVLNYASPKSFVLGSTRLARLKLNGGVGLTLGSLTISDSLTLTNGILTMATGADVLTLEATIKLRGGNNTSYVDGKVTRKGKGNLLFPLGTASNYLPVTAYNVNGTAPVVSATVGAAPAYTAGDGVEALISFPYAWTITSTNPADTATNVEVQYPNTLPTSTNPIVVQKTAGQSKFESMGAQSFSNANGKAIVKSYAPGLHNIFSVASGLSANFDPATTNATGILSNGFTANWTAVAGATSYELDVSADNFATFLGGYDGKSTTNLNDVITGLEANTTYAFRVRAVKTGLKSPNSNVVTVSTLPNAPFATAATGISLSGFTANWDAFENATGYQLDISADNFSTFITGYNSKSVNATSEVVTGLTASTAYKYRVRAITSNGTSANSNVIDVTTGANPVAPVASAATSITTTGFTANWAAAANATGYQLDISADNFGTFITGYNSKSVNATSEVVTGLTASTAYKYRVRAVTSNGTSPNSNVIDVTTAANPVAPVASAATSITSTGFTANWAAAANVTGYQLDISADNFATFVTGYNSKSVNATSEVVTGLTANTAYKYRVRAVTSNGTSPNSNVIDVTTAANPVAPVASAATSITSTGFTANWAAAANATGYQLDISADNFATFVTGFNSKSVNATSEVVTGLTASTAYKYRVRAVTSSGTSSNSNVIDVTTADNIAAPVATAATSITSSGFTANWATTANATGYQLDISSDNFSTFVSGYNAKVVTATSEAVTGLSPATAYQYRVRAIVGTSLSANSNVVTATTGVAGVSPPIAPVATNATGIGLTSFTATWTASANATGYQLDVSADNFSTFLAGYSSKVLGAVNSEVVSGLSQGTTYRYRVRASNTGGVSANSNTIEVSTNSTSKTNQTITFGALPDRTLGEPAFTLTATASSDLVVNFASTSEEITISGNTVTMVKAGRAAITASQGGNASFNAAAPVERSFCIKPSKPTITVSGSNSETPTLTSSAASGNQWFKDGVAVSGETSASLNVSTPGVYKVQVKVEDCISDFSADVSIIVTGDSANPLASVVASPNPAETFLEVYGLRGEIRNPRLFDLTGRISSVTLERNSDHSHRLDVGQLSGGVYLLLVQDERNVHQIKFIKK